MCSISNIHVHTHEQYSVRVIDLFTHFFLSSSLLCCTVPCYSLSLLLPFWIKCVRVKKREKRKILELKRTEQSSDRKNY
jgi:hypothetical protein